MAEAFTPLRPRLNHRICGGKPSTASWSKHRTGQLDDNGDQMIRDWERPPFYMGNRFPGKEGNLCECSVPLPPESIALAQLAVQASQCDEPETLEFPSVLLGTYL